jgi:hypothetical protein
MAVYFRAINKSGKIWGQGMTPKVLWEIVKRAVETADIDKLALHDLRRTHVRVFAVWQEASSTKFNSSSATCPSRQPNITSAVSRSSGSL